MSARNVPSLGRPSVALALSVALHVSLLAVGAFWLSRSLAEAPPHRAFVPPGAALEVSLELALPEVSAFGEESAQPTLMPVPALTAHGGRVVPRPDLQHAGRGGERAARDAATNLASALDPISLERDPDTQRERSQVSRLHSSWVRATRDDRRATPNPAELTFLASGPGNVPRRRSPTTEAAARGVRDGDRAEIVGSRLGGARSTEQGKGPEPESGGAIQGMQQERLGPGVESAQDDPDRRSSASRVLFARPLVPAARAAVPAAERGRPNDTLDSSQEVAARVSALLHASTAGGDPGPGLGGERGGTLPGARGTSGAGSRSSASGAAFGRDFSDEPGSSGYLRGIRARLQRALRGAFPDWAIEQGRGGVVIFDLTLRADGSPAAVRIVRPSGIDDYDRKVVRAASALSFGALPSGWSAPTVVRISWDALNTVIGREGGGPGGSHR